MPRVSNDQIPAPIINYVPGKGGALNPEYKRFRFVTIGLAALQRWARGETRFAPSERLPDRWCLGPWVYDEWSCCLLIRLWSPDYCAVEEAKPYPEIHLVYGPANDLSHPKFISIVSMDEEFEDMVAEVVCLHNARRGKSGRVFLPAP